MLSAASLSREFHANTKKYAQPVYPFQNLKWSQMIVTAITHQSTLYRSSTDDAN